MVALALVLGGSAAAFELAAVVLAAVGSAALVIACIENDDCRQGVIDLVNQGQATAEALTDHFIWFTKKRDIEFLDYIADKYGLKPEQRDELHDNIRDAGLSNNPAAIRREAKAIKDRERAHHGEEAEYNEDDLAYDE